MIDTHCHLDLYPHPIEIAQASDRARVITIAVTNLPSAFESAYPYVRPFKYVRLALGLHPLMADQHLREREGFRRLVDRTSYIGEVGLDFSPEARSTRTIQIDSFRFVLKALHGKTKFITLHSRRAESAVLDALEEHCCSPAVFHWFTGPPTALERALRLGHYFSANPAMCLSPKGRKTIASLPRDRLLSETDGPFVRIGRRSAVPSDVAMVEDYLSGLWDTDKQTVSRILRQNLSEILRPLRGNS